jgi:PPK2 family polyphosphate:nucleotide phosphotransferase
MRNRYRTGRAIQPRHDLSVSGNRRPDDKPPGQTVGNLRVPKPVTLLPGKTCDLSKIPSRVDSAEFDSDSAYAKIDANAQRMERISQKLFAENKRSVLLILQGMDAAGKDSTVRSVTRGMNPRSLVVHSFGVPSAEELDHDFLWRIHYRVPRKGNIGIFNRSHYEDVLVVRVHDLCPGVDWKQRYRQINEFEELLVENGTTILKCYLHISKEEQRERLQARIDDPKSHWQVNLRDHEERKFWDEYQAAFNDAITCCNTSYAPWFIIPADRKWYRKLVISELMLNTLESMDPQFPEPESEYRGIVVQ